MSTTEMSVSERVTLEYKRLGATLRAMREAAGLSQRELARRAGISHTSLSKYEHGRAVDYDVRRRIIRGIADELPRSRNA